MSSLARNSLALSVRMALRMAVSLYTTRVVLDALGVEDYGIYNVVAGFSLLFTFVNASMGTAMSRFIAYDVGQGKEGGELRKTFQTSFTVQLLLAACCLAVAEAAGVPIINHILDVPEGKMGAANILYQCTLAGLLINMMVVPYNAVIIAYEKMTAYAYIEIGYSASLLAIAVLLYAFSSHLLIVYGALMVCAYLANFLCYHLYCQRFALCRPRVLIERRHMMPMLRFSVSDLFATGSSSLQSQGQSVILNKFFGVVANASAGVASQIYGALLSFSNSITIAVRPRIIKSYARRDHEAVVRYALDGSKLLSFFSIIIGLPLIIGMRAVLSLWLKETPEYTCGFAQTIVLCQIVFGFKGLLTIVLHASGAIARFSAVMGAWYLAMIPLQLVLGLAGLNAYALYSVVLLASFVNVCLVVAFIRRICHINLVRATLSLSALNTLVMAASLVAALSARRYAGETLAGAALESAAALLVAVPMSYRLVLSEHDRTYICLMARKALAKF